MRLSRCISRSSFLFPPLFLLTLALFHSILSPLCPSFVLSSLSVYHPPFPSAHVDMSTVAFDVDPLDLDAEEPPENQGDPRSSKGMSGSVTSPQANAHRLPFFKKVTLGGSGHRLPRHPPPLHPPPSPRKHGQVSSAPAALRPLAPLPALSLTNTNTTTPAGSSRI